MTHNTARYRWANHDGLPAIPEYPLADSLPSLPDKWGTSTTAHNLHYAKSLMEIYGRERFSSYSSNGYCPLGAIAAARGFLPEMGRSQFEHQVYQETPEAQALAHAIESAYPKDSIDPQHPYYQASTVVHCWNDETVSDAKVFKIFDDAIALAKIKDAA